MTPSRQTEPGGLTRRSFLGLGAAALAGRLLHRLRSYGLAPAGALESDLQSARQQGTRARPAYGRWLNASWTTMTYPERYDCDLPIWYMAMWAKEQGLPIDWTWENYFRQPVVNRLTETPTRDLLLQSWRVATYEEFAGLAQAYFGIKHLPTLVARTGGRQLAGSALDIAWGKSIDQLCPGDIISSGGHAMVFIEPYRSIGHYIWDYRRPLMLQRTLRQIEENAARLPPEDRAEYEARVLPLRRRIARHVRSLQAAEEWMGYHSPGNPWDPAIEEALARGAIPGFVPGRMVDSPGVDSPRGDWSQLFSGIVYPDLSDRPLPHITSGSGRTVWEWFRSPAGGEACDWRCNTVVLRPFGDG